MRLVLSLLTLLALAPAARAQIPEVVRVGVLTDMSGPFADQVGQGSVVAAQMAAEDFNATNPGFRVQIVFADHQNKPDVGSGIARRWVDTEGVHTIVDLPNSGVGLAVIQVMKERNLTALASSTASSAVTGAACAATTVQWTSDTWAQGNAVARAVMQQGGNAWYYLTVDYALGHSLEADTSAAVTRLGGRNVGSARHPLNTGDMSSLLVRAQSSGANVIALANTGTDAINAIKQANEFGLLRGGRMRIAATFLQISDVHSLGLQVAQGLLLAEPFYWDTNEATRAWSARWGARMQERRPTFNHAGVYSATMAWLHAVKAAGTVQGERVVAQMRQGVTHDPLFGDVTVRPDGRAVHEMHVFRVKTPAESRGPYDYYQRIATIPASDAFRPLGEGGCPLVR